MLRLRELRKSKKLSQQQLANLLGVTQATLSGWENEKYEIDNDSLLKCSDIFNTSIDYILGRTDETYNILYNLAQEMYYDDEFKNLSIDDKKKVLYNIERSTKIPVLGSIPAGIPFEAIEDIIGEEEIPAEWTLGGKEFFALKIKGDSMYPKYISGDIVIFEKCDTCENGDECAVMVNGDDATFKKVERMEIGIILKPLNPAFDSTFYSNDDITNKPIRIIGKAVEIRRKV